MTETNARLRRATTRPSRSEAEIREFKTWLASIEGITLLPTVHVNGPHFPTAVVAVDFGSPLEPVKLRQELQTELVNRMRQVTRDLLGREANVRVSTDSTAGIWWTSIG